MEHMETNASLFAYYQKKVYPTLTEEYLTELLQLDNLIIDHIMEQNAESAEHYVTTFNLKLLHLPEENQLNTLRFYYIGLVASILRLRRQWGTLNINDTANGAAIMRTISNWQYISEFFSSIPWLTRQMMEIMSIGDSLLKKKPILAALKLIQDNIMESHLSVRWLASELQISQPYLSSSFKQETGENVSTFISRQKMKLAAIDLQFARLSVTEIQQKYHYRSGSHFIKLFKTYYKKTPSQYRKAYYRKITTLNQN